MTTAKPFESIMGVDIQKAAIERHLAELRVALNGPPSDAALASYHGLHAEVDGCVGKIKRRLLGTALAWTDEEKEASAWIYYTSHRMDRLGRRLVDALSRMHGAADDRTLGVATLALLYMGESVKCQVNVGRHDAYDYAATHAMMNLALSTGRQSDERHFAFDGHPVA